jgi:hypothetical protein
MKIRISELRRLIKEQLLLEFKQAKEVTSEDIETVINYCFRENNLKQRDFEKKLWQSNFDEEKNIEAGYEFEKVCENISSNLNNVVKKWYDGTTIERGRIFASKEEDKEIHDKIRDVLLNAKLYGENVTEVPKSIKFVLDADIPKNLVKEIDGLMQMTLDATEKVLSKPRSKSSEINSIVARIEADLRSLESKIAVEDPSISNSLGDLTSSIQKILQNLRSKSSSTIDRNKATRVESFQRKRK